MVNEHEGLLLRTKFRQIYYPDRKTHNYGSAAAFAESMRKYVHEYREWTKFCQERQMDQWAQHSRQVLNIIGRSDSDGNVNVNAARANAGVPHAQAMFTAEPATIIRRVIAETIDFFICLTMKLMLVIVLMEFDLIDTEKFQKALDNDSDFTQFITMTQNLLPLEIAAKVFCAFLEGLCMVIPLFPLHRGQTPGKYIMRIRVISAEQVHDSNVPNQLLVIGGGELTLFQSIARSIAKNMFVNSLFPLTTIMFNINPMRSVYDSMLRTLVIMC